MKQINNKSRMSVCLKAIKDYVDLDEAKVSKEEQNHIKARAKLAIEQFPILDSTQTKDVLLQSCGPLPSIG